MTRLAKALSAQFGPSCEIVVHDLEKADTEHTIAVIENGEVSHRHAGGGASKIVLEALSRRDDPNLRDSLGYLTRTKDGRILKSSTVYLRNEEGLVEGVLAINYDITEFLMAERAVGTLLNHKEEKKTPDRIPQNVNDLLDDLIEQSVSMVGKPVAMMSKEDKVNAIQFLNKSGAFLVTKSGDKVSRFFGISKYTLYSYIDAKKDE